PESLTLQKAGVHLRCGDYIAVADHLGEKRELAEETSGGELAQDLLPARRIGAAHFQPPPRHNNQEMNRFTPVDQMLARFEAPVLSRLSQARQVLFREEAQQRHMFHAADDI